MRKIFLLPCLVLLFVSCSDNKDSGKKFTVTGLIRNSSAKMVYLEKIPGSMTQSTVEDSVLIGKDGKFSLHSEASESVVFNLRLDQSQYPVASVINDTNEVKLDILLNKDNSQFAEKYDVSGSPASQKLKDFIFEFNNNLMKIYTLDQQADSLKRTGNSDSLISPLLQEQKAIGDKVRDYSLQAIASANDPALLIFELGYYQSTANTTRYGLPAITDDQVMGILNTAATQFPAHQVLASIKASIDQQQQKAMLSNWVGREAPDFAMPDVNGKEIRLSSFRGKYVLVDFWASWCGPCREENPNVVDAFNKYKTKNFTVLGVSLDRPGQKDKWVKAIQDDKLLWTNISDLQYWESPIVALYGLDGIPFNILVDPSGKVIAQALRGPALHEALDKNLH